MSLIDVGAALAFRKRFGRSFEHFGLFQPSFLEGQVEQVYGEIWNGGWQSGSMLINVDTKLANLQPARAADH